MANSKQTAWISHEAWRKAHIRQQENRRAAASEPLLTVQVVPGGSPVSNGSTVFYPGQQFQIRFTLANSLVAQGRVTIVP
jgi:hypothetical protein